MSKILVPRKYSRTLNEEEIAKIFNLPIEEMKRITEECNKSLERVAIIAEKASSSIKAILPQLSTGNLNLDEEIKKLRIDNSAKKKKGKVKKNWERNKFYERY